MSGPAAPPAGPLAQAAGPVAAGSAVLTGSVGAMPLRTAAVLEAITRAILAGELPPGRSLVETEAVRRAVAGHSVGHHSAGTDGHGSMLAGAREALGRADAAPDQAARSLANREFHRALYLDCGNPLLTGALDHLRDQTALISVAAWQQAPSWRQEAG